jgi:hypothetical protein
MGVGLCSILYMNFYEKALFVKPTWRLLLEAECNGFECPSRYASIRTLGELSVLGSSVHRMRSVLIRALPRRCNLPIGLLLWDGPSSLAQSP